MNNNKTYIALGVAGTLGVLSLWEYLGRHKETSLLLTKIRESNSSSSGCAAGNNISSTDDDSNSASTITKKESYTPLYVTIRPSTVATWSGSKLYNLSGYGTDNFLFRVITGGSTLVILIGGYGVYNERIPLPKLLRN